MARSEEYVIIPGTGQKVYEGSVVMLYRLPNLRWILHYGYYSHNAKKQQGWYFSSIPSDTTMPVFNEDLVAMKVIDGQPGPMPPAPPVPPFPPFPPFPEFHNLLLFQNNSSIPSAPSHPVCKPRQGRKIIGRWWSRRRNPCNIGMNHYV